MSKELFQEERQEQEPKPSYSIDGIIRYLNDLTESVESGDSDSIVTLAKIKNVEKILKECTQSIYNCALSEAENYPEKTFNHKGVKVEKRAGRKVYDFNGIPQWLSKNNELKSFETQCKAAYSAYEKGVKMFDEETGEEIPIPAVKNTKDVLILKYAD